METNTKEPEPSGRQSQNNTYANTFVPFRGFYRNVSSYSADLLYI